MESSSETVVGDSNLMKLTNFMIALMIFIPTGAAVYFWKKKSHYEKQLQVISPGRKGIQSRKYPEIALFKKAKSREKESSECACGSLTESIEWLDNTLTATNTSLFEMMNMVSKMTTDLKSIHSEHLYLSKHLANLEKQRLKPLKRY